MDAGLITIYTIIALTFGVWWVIKNKYSYWKNRRVPHLQPIIPYGNLKGVGKTIHTKDFLCDIYDTHKKKHPLIGVYFFAEPVAIILDFDLARNILVKEFDTFHDRRDYYNEKSDPLTAHMAYLEGEKWKLIRQKLSPAFTAAQMKRIFPLVNDLADRMFAVIDPMTKTEEPVEIRDIINRFVVDIAGNVIYGIECNSLKNPDDNFRLMGEQIFSSPRHSELVRIFMQSFPDIARFFQMKTFKDDVSSFFMKIIGDTISYREKANLKRNDFMDLLIQLKNTGTLQGHDGHIGKLTENEIAAQAFLFFFTSMETSANSFGSAMYELSRHPEVQEKVRKEIFSVLAKNNGEFTYDLIKEMKYLQQIIDETLRIYPPAMHLIRKARRNYNVPNTKYTIEKGVQVLIPTGAYHLDPEVFPNPRDFNPDNFTAEAIAKRHPYSYLPFGDGPRNCIGLRMGRMINNIGMVKLLTNYRVTVSPLTPESLSFVNGVHIMQPTSDFYLLFEKL